MNSLLATPSSSQLEAFAGTVVCGANAVDPTVLADKRVALVGDPRRVVRSVPIVADSASALKVFQTEGIWVLPSYGPLDKVIDALAGPLPSALRWRLAATAARCNLKRSVRDAWTQRQLEPQLDAGGTTVVRSGGYYRSLRRRNVELIWWPIAGVVPQGIRTADGIEHHVDVVLLV